MPTVAPPRSLERGLRLLQLLQDHDSLSFSELLEHLSLPNTTVTRLLSALTELAYIEKAEDGRYRLCPDRRIPGQTSISARQLLHAARPMLDYMRRQMHNTALLLHWSGKQTICLERMLHEDSAPLHGPGHIIGDHSYTPWGYFVDDPHSWLRGPKRKPDRPRYKLTHTSIDKMLKHYQRHGYAYDLLTTRNRIACPIYFQKNICGILVLGGTPASLTLSDIKIHGPHMRDLADTCRQLL